MALTKITRGVIKANENYDTHNINSTGIVTAVTFTGNVTGVAATFTGDVSIGGTLTYQDVTNIDSVGIITAQSDISIADKIVHTGDTNTALRFPAADTITAETGGTERLRITSGGAVQITGVDDQDNLLVKGGSTHFAVHQDDTDGEVSLRAQDGSGSNNSKYMTFFTNPSGSAAAERLRITSAGFLGINETSPDSVLHVKSGTTNDVATFESTDAYAHIYIKDNSTHATGTYFGVQGNDFRFITHDGSSSSERVRITSDGKVGVGIAAPNVFGVHANNSSNSVYFKADSGSVSTVYGSATALGTGVLGTFTNHALAFYTNSNEKLRVDSSGRVLIGRTSTQNENIAGIGYANIVQIEGNATGEGLTVANSAAAARINITRDLATGSITNGMDLGLISFGSESPTSVERARIQCDAEFTNANERGGRLKFFTCANGSFTPTERLRITSNGDIGIGNVIPGNSFPNGKAIAIGDSDTGIRQNGDGILELWANNQQCFRVRNTENLSYKTLSPGADNSVDLGTSSLRWRNIYTADLQMSNEGSANDVDGTWGKYTIQEGENDLFLINRRNGKKYKFNLTEVG